MLKHETQVSIADYPNCLKGQSSTKYNNDKDILSFAGIGGKYILLNVDLWIKLAFKKVNQIMPFFFRESIF